MNMKKIAIINATSFGSTGNIACNIIDKYEGEAKLFCFYTKKDRDNVIPIKLNKIVDLTSHALSRIDGKDGFHYHAFSKKLIEELDKFKPDIIHLHNIHGYYCNMPLLFDYINKNHIKVIWTLHDFWIMTGRCAHPSDCEGYLKGCPNCKRGKIYPYAIFHNEKWMFKKKKELVESIEDLTLVSPSQYVKDLIKTSHLSSKDIKVINNGIKIDLFYYEESKLKEELGINKDKKVLLNVSMPYYKEKGIDYLNLLADQLDENKYQIVCIGPLVDGNTLNSKIIHVPFVEQDKLHLYYSMADLFINPTLADNYPTVDMEAIACNLPVISFDTGGSKEIVTEDVGKIIPYKDLEALKEAIEKYNKDSFDKKAFALKREKFNLDNMLNSYIDLYK